jgi:hypothetical protein
MDENKRYMAAAKTEKNGLGELRGQFGPGLKVALTMWSSKVQCF